VHKCKEREREKCIFKDIYNIYNVCTHYIRIGVYIYMYLRGKVGVCVCLDGYSKFKCSVSLGGCQ
jgi:hypothetical protein